MREGGREGEGRDRRVWGGRDRRVWGGRERGGIERA